MSAQPGQGRRQPAASTDNRKGTDMAKPKPAPVEPEVEIADAIIEPADDGRTAVTTTFNPLEVIRVGDAELLDLERQGLVHTYVDGEPANDDEVGEVTHSNGVVESGVITDQPLEGGSTESEVRP